MTCPIFKPFGTRFPAPSPPILPGLHAIPGMHAKWYVHYVGVNDALLDEMKSK